jgi:large repetitive protein
MKELNEALAKSGINDAKIGIRGSAVTGQNSRTGAKFTQGTSDIDVFVESDKLVAGLKTSQTSGLEGMVHPGRIAKAFPAVEEWSVRWSEIIGGKGVGVAGFPNGGLPKQPYVYTGQ